MFIQPLGVFNLKMPKGTMYVMPACILLDFEGTQEDQFDDIYYFSDIKSGDVTMQSQGAWLVGNGYIKFSDRQESIYFARTDYEDPVKLINSIISTTSLEDLKELAEIFERAAQYGHCYQKIWSDLCENNPAIKKHEYHEEVDFKDKNHYPDSLTFTKNNWFSYDDEAIYLLSEDQDLSMPLEQITVESIHSLQKLTYDDRIIFFAERGDKRVEQKVYSTGGDISLGGAVAGAIIAGDAGAIIGGRKTMSVQTENTLVDDRYVELRYYDNDGRIKRMNLGYYYFDIFMRLMPQKELTYVQLQSAPRQDLDDVANRVAKLKKMLDTGIITEEDFTTQKNRILNSI